MYPSSKGEAQPLISHRCVRLLSIIARMSDDLTASTADVSLTSPVSTATPTSSEEQPKVKSPAAATAEEAKQEYIPNCLDLLLALPRLGHTYAVVLQYVTNKGPVHEGFAAFVQESLTEKPVASGLAWSTYTARYPSKDYVIAATKSTLEIDVISLVMTTKLNQIVQAASEKFQLPDDNRVGVQLALYRCG